ncbi:uncharacterized protein [Elaeis guineensis]|uniref:Aminoacyl tRNA synthase complex-interacting multifunctional protein 1 n=1 Tax=Elaeis guineensis var. tenera TaxID=51953 RepID=A0A6I9QGU8_ELAGV|nr:aminoacyl tRNA synthase complex-interacting multifunctional protein 1 [Elaeis guineensis]
MMAAVSRTGVLISSAFVAGRHGRRFSSLSFSSGKFSLRSGRNAGGCGGGGLLSFLPFSRSRGVCSTFAPHAAVETSGAAAEDASTPPPSDPVKEAADALDIRVGRVLRAWRHPEADTLYVEEVDVGEAEPRIICSGLVNYIPVDHLQDAKVVVLANLKPRNMRGIKSNGMLMAVSDESRETVELLLPPEGSVPGERIWFGSEDGKDRQPEAATPNQVQKKKIWESVQPHLKTTDACVAVLRVHPMRTSAGMVTCRSLKHARIS